MKSWAPTRTLRVLLLLSAVLMAAPGCVHVSYGWESQKNSFAQMGPGFGHSTTNENGGQWGSAERGWITDWASWTFWADVSRAWSTDLDRITQP